MIAGRDSVCETETEQRVQSHRPRHQRPPGPHVDGGGHESRLTTADDRVRVDFGFGHLETSRDSHGRNATAQVNIRYALAHDAGTLTVDVDAMSNTF